MDGRRRISNAATFVAVLSAPAAVAWSMHHGLSVAASVVVAVLAVAAFRGLIDLVLRRVDPQPDLFGRASKEARTKDALERRRTNFWKTTFRWSPLWALVVWQHAALVGLLSQPAILVQLAILPMFFLFNFLIMMGPMMAMGISQIKAFEPGEAGWGVELEDVRGQKEAKDEVRKIIELWQSGTAFTKAGGKRERGILLLGAPGTGKTMLAKAIATGFNCPIVTIPGSGFAQTFIGMDVVIVMYLSMRAKRLAKKWGGQCIVFIDEIDAVGMRRNALGARRDIVPGGMFGMGGGGLALNQLLVVMDGIDSPPAMRKLIRKRINTALDALYVVPQQIGRLKLRLPAAKPTGNQIYFIGATNVPLEALDPALVRAGRMGRHIHFRRPTKRDRADVFDLYLGKVRHEEALDTEEAREELARVTSGYSPAEIEQVCSLALTYAHHDGRDRFDRKDVLEAMVTLEAGTALGWGYESRAEEKAVAVHEAGHAVCGHLYLKNEESTRLTIRRRGDTGGHHQVAERIERMFHFRDEVFYGLVWGLGAYAAELVFYGANSQGVGGDLGEASRQAAEMVARHGMAPPLKCTAAQLKRFEAIGQRLLSVPGTDGLLYEYEDDSAKVMAQAAILGQAFYVAYNTARINRAAIERVSEALVEQKDIYGNDLISLLDGCNLKAAKTTPAAMRVQSSWPKQ